MTAAKKKPVITIGVDPGAKSGVAIWRDGKLVAYGLVKSTAEEIDGKLSGIVQLARTAGIEMDGNRFRADDEIGFATEAQYLKAPPRSEMGRDDKPDPSASGRFTAMLSVVTSAVVWRTIARIMRARVAEPIHAVSWRATFGISKSQGRPDLKKQAVSMVKEKIGVAVTDDVAEAILLGLHYHVQRLGAEVPVSLSWVLAQRLVRKAAAARARTNRRSVEKSHVEG